MRSKNLLLRNSRLYAILDKDAAGAKRLIPTAKALLRSGVDIVQLRDKGASKKEFLSEALALRKFFSGSKTLFILNDHIDIAQSIDCDGVHLGQEDLPLPIARRLLGSKKLIGISCHTIAQARRAQHDGANYIGIGPVFATPTKPAYRPKGLGLIRQCRRTIRIPFFAIGGIELSNASKVRSAGAHRIAVCRALCQTENIAATVIRFKDILDF